MIHNKYQIDIFKEVKETNNHVCIVAGPGSGKTTTIVEAVKLIKPFKKTIFLAFNKSIVEELKKRVPNYIETSTLHKKGYQYLSKYYRKLRLFDMKTFSFADKMISQWKIKDEDKGYYCYQLLKLYNLYRMNLGENKDDIKDIADKYGISIFEDKDINNAEQLFEKIDEYNRVIDYQETKSIDFTDMIYLPATYDNIKVEKYDVIFIDEYQDLNRAQNAFIEKMLKPNGRMIVVGDKNQTIYAFSGADQSLFEKFEKRSDVTSLPLSISYRLPKTGVDNVNKIYPVVEAWKNAALGEVRDGSLIELKDGDFVLCRVNRPLISLYFRLLGQSKKCFIKGKDIGDDLINLCKKVKRHSMKNGLEHLYDELEIVEEKLTKRGVKNPRSHNTYLSLLEKIQSIETIASHCTTLTEVIDMLEKIFQEDGEGIILMTVHKSKGLETDNVFILQPQLLGVITKEMRGWEIISETNIKFVAHSRHKKKLIFIDDFTEAKI